MLDRAISQWAARPALMANSTTRLFSTGKTPGKPAHTGQVLCIGLLAKLGRTAAEDLRLSQELGVDFQAYDAFVFHDDNEFKIKNAKLKDLLPKFSIFNFEFLIWAFFCAIRSTVRNDARREESSLHQSVCR